MLARRTFFTIAFMALVAVAAVAAWSHARPASANPLTGVVAISAGDVSTCALTEAGGVKCWGETGLFGDPIDSRSPVPIDIPGLETGVASVASGVQSTCVVMDTGGVKCWGLGYGPTPSDVRGLGGDAVAVSLGQNVACALTQAHAVECWGYSSIANGADELSAGVAEVSVGEDHACLVTEQGAVKCWGRNQFGEVGAVTTGCEAQFQSCSPTPVDVAGLPAIAKVVAGLDHSCALDQSGAVWCWGLGWGVTPVEMTALEDDVTAISATYGYTCALTTTGVVQCWGANDFGQLGDSKACGGACLEPVTVSGLRGPATAVAAGVHHTCVLTESGGAQCWGNNYWGQLGDGTRGLDNISYSPVDVVQVTRKPTPTFTPCPAEGCPPPTPTPTTVPPRQDGLDFSIGVDTDGDGSDDCSTRAGAPADCFLSPDSSFELHVYLDSLPVDVSGYLGFQVGLEYAGVVSKDDATPGHWPDCVFAASYFEPGWLLFGCTSGVSQQASTYTGLVGTSGFNCLGPGSVTMVHEHRSEWNDEPETLIVAWTDQQIHGETGRSESLIMLCGPPLVGDVDCTTAIDSVDGTLVLQYHAALLSRLGCPQHADANQDSAVNSIDASLILQVEAGFTDSLPPP